MRQHATCVARLLGVLLAGTCLTGTAGAATFYNGWYYAIDSSNDGSGGSNYEYRGLAFTTKNGRIYVGISSGMPVNGNAESGALNGRINHGDVFFNFTGNNLNSAAAFNQPGVFGVRFDPLNDSLGNIGGSNTTLGVFDQLTVVSLSTLNQGFPTLLAYNSAGYGRTVDAMADLESTLGDVAAYFGTGAMYPNIQSGRYLGGITLHNRAQLIAQGLNFGHFGIDLGTNRVFGFSFDQSLFPGGDFTMHLFQECINDGMALRAANVPEPETYALVGAGALTLAGMLYRRRARR